MLRSGERGRFALPPVPDAEVELIISKDDFDEVRYAVHQLTADRTIDVVLTPQHVHREWSGTFTSIVDDGGHHPVVTGWEEPYEFDMHRAGEVSMHLDTCTDVGGTYIEFGFGLVSSSYGPVLGVESRLHLHDAKASLPAGHYRLEGGFSAPFPGIPCAWALSLVRPY